MSVKPIPEGYHSITPYITVDDAAKAIDFYKAALGATEIVRMEMGGKIGHAEVRIGDSVVMLSDEWPDRGKLGPKSRGGPTSSLMVYVQDVDAAFTKAVGAGAVETMPVADQFWGDRMGGLRDPFGHEWMLATHVEDVPEDEMKRRMDAMAMA